MCDDARRPPRFPRSLVCRSSLADVMMETVLKLSSLAQLEVFLLIEKSDCRVFAGKDRFCKSYVEGSLSDSGSDVRLECDSGILRVKDQEYLSLIDNEAGEAENSLSSDKPQSENQSSKKSTSIAEPKSRPHRKREAALVPSAASFVSPSKRIKTETEKLDSMHLDFIEPQIDFCDEDTKALPGTYVAANDKNSDEFHNEDITPFEPKLTEPIFFLDKNPSDPISSAISNLDLSWFESKFTRDNSNYDVVRRMMRESQLKLNSVTRRSLDRLLYQLGREAGDRFIALGLAESDKDAWLELLAKRFCLSLPHFEKLRRFLVDQRRDDFAFLYFERHVRTNIDDGFESAFEYEEKRKKGLNSSRSSLTDVAIESSAKDSLHRPRVPNLPHQVHPDASTAITINSTLDVSWIVNDFVRGNPNFDFLLEATVKTDFDFGSMERKAFDSLLYELGREAGLRFMSHGLSADDRDIINPYVDAITEEFCLSLPNFEELREIKLKESYKRLVKLRGYVRRCMRRSFMRTLVKPKRKKVKLSN